MVSNPEIHEWISDVSGPQWYWYAKILAGNDTLLTGAHQAGPYVPRQVVFTLFPSIASSRDLNPRQSFDVSIDSHGVSTACTAIWYNNRLVAEGTRNETRITGWGGQSSPILDPDSTGSLCVFAFLRLGEGDATACRVWLARSLEEEEALSSRLGGVEPGISVFLDPREADLDFFGRDLDQPCRIPREQIPPEWLDRFPTPSAVHALSVARLPSARENTPDDRLMARRACEFELFRSVEEAAVLPRIVSGFESVDLFIDYANAVTNRRKARSGASLELQLRTIFDEEGVEYSHGELSEYGKRPDFLFPSADAYLDSSFPANRLRMLGVKTTVKDRWRQVIDEADRIPTKHLLTLQEGVSTTQFDQMSRAGILLVVPQRLHSSFPNTVRPHLLTLSRFIGELELA
jgi:hypothetical protein